MSFEDLKYERITHSPTGPDKSDADDIWGHLTQEERQQVIMAKKPEVPNGLETEFQTMHENFCTIMCGPCGNKHHIEFCSDMKKFKEKLRCQKSALNLLEWPDKIEIQNTVNMRSARATTWNEPIIWMKSQFEFPDESCIKQEEQRIISRHGTAWQFRHAIDWLRSQIKLAPSKDIKEPAFDKIAKEVVQESIVLHDAGGLD